MPTHRFRETRRYTKPIDGKKSIDALRPVIAARPVDAATPVDAAIFVSKNDHLPHAHFYSPARRGKLWNLSLCLSSSYADDTKCGTVHGDKGT